MVVDQTLLQLMIILICWRGECLLPALDNVDLGWEMYTPLLLVSNGPTCLLHIRFLFIFFAFILPIFPHLS